MSSTPQSTPVAKASPSGQERLVLVSNRIPIALTKEDGQIVAKPSSGGLVAALEPIIKEHGGVWIGNVGLEDSPELRKELEAATRAQNFHYTPVFLTEEEQANYYEGFSNEVVWPLFHDLQSRCVFQPAYWDFYQRVNQKFAQAIDEQARPDDIIWVHDYQLLQVARFVRESRPNAFLSLFLHIPFPSPDIFGKLPWRQQLLDGLLAFDFVGLQTGRDERNLIASIRCYHHEVKVARSENRRMLISASRTTSVGAFPISIDFQEIARAAAEIAVAQRASEVRAQNAGLHVALGVDRLDYTKGIPERLRALRAFFRLYPEYRRRLTLIQVVVPSREGISGYQDLLLEVQQLVSSVNGELGEPGWTPVQYLHRSVPRDELLALYRAAHIALVTPLKDGMNLVAKEYCAAHVDRDGVLILSEFAGAMAELHAGAIQVHPYDELGIAEALKKAFEMSSEERHRRMLRLRNQIRKADISAWRDHIFSQIQHACKMEGSSVVCPAP